VFTLVGICITSCNHTTEMLHQHSIAVSLSMHNPHSELNTGSESIATAMYHYNATTSTTNYYMKRKRNSACKLYAVVYVK
jgi:hypothetical protein